MRKNDIKSIGDIYTRLIESLEDTTVANTQTASGNTGEIDPNSLYSHGLDKLRINDFKTESGEPIVLFYTEKISDTENDKLHCAEGPCVIFGEGGPENEYYFIHGEHLEEGANDPRFINAANKVAAGSSQDVADVFGDTDSTF